MKKLTSLSALLLLAGAVGLVSCSDGDANPNPSPGQSEPDPENEDPDAPVDGRRLVVLFTSDEHSHLFAFSPELDDWPLATSAGQGALTGGIARRATVLARERKAAKEAGKATLTLSSGDNQMGALPHIAFESGSLDYRALHALGYDATTLGNHELDLGPRALANAVSAAKAQGGLPPIVASNLYFSDEDPGDDELEALMGEGDDKPIQRYRVLVADNGIKVGIIGYLGVNASHVSTNKAPVSFSEREVALEERSKPEAVLPKLYEDLQPIVDKLRSEEGVDLVIALGHAGIVDPKNPETGEDYKIAANVSGIDLILSGHEHSSDDTPVVVKNAKSGRDVLVLNGSSYGRHVGRVELIVPDDPSEPVSWDLASQALLPITDEIIPDPSYTPKLEAILSEVEAAGKVGDKSFLERLLSRVEGEDVSMGETPGKLYFHPIGKTSFDLAKSPAMLYLTADAMLAAADEVNPAQIAIQSAGVVRSGLMKGKTGTISAADAFAVLPLGMSPVDSSLGYPLVRAHLNSFFIRAIFEFASAVGPTNSQYDLAPAGLLVEYDCSRPPAASQGDLLNSKKGRVMRMWIDTDHSDGFEQYDRLIYDRENPSKNAPNGELFSIVTSSYIAEFAGDVGAALLDASGQPTTLDEIVLYRDDASELKEVEAFMSYVKTRPERAVPERYNPQSGEATARFEKMKLCQ